MFDGRWRLTGVTVIQKGPSPVSALVVTVLIAAAFAGAAWYLVPGRVGPVSELAYRASLPALEQELLYRGFLLAALDRAFGAPVRLRGAAMGWGAVASAMLFAADRALSLSPDLVLTAAFGAGAWVFLAGMLLVWLRAASGSVLLPVLVHSWAVASFYAL
jgi:membrane protease YdiL (CAAX protease family)